MLLTGPFLDDDSRCAKRGKPKQVFIRGGEFEGIIWLSKPQNLMVLPYLNL